MENRNNLDIIDKNGVKWRVIKGFEDYQVSEKGGIISNRSKRKILSMVQSKILYVNLYTNEKIVRKQLCYLVATAFMDNPNNYTLIKFFDGNRLNVCKNNMEWSNNPYSSDEVWEPLRGFSKYEITRTGKIRNFVTKVELTPEDPEDSYQRISLVNDKGRSKHKYIHNLVADQFIPNPDNLPVVNHENGNKQDYSIENLEF